MSVKKTYWKGLSEKHQTPEFVEANSNEFQEDLPIDKFIGDAVMAFWGAPIHQDDHAKLGVSTAIEMNNLFKTTTSNI